jgi:eukaryotic-like serine/threonine-protein kinase
MAEETRQYRGGPAPKEQPSGAPLALAETDVAATVLPSRPVASAQSNAVVPVVEQSVPAELAPGTEVGEYRILCKLGQGGMGAVYAGEQPAIGKRVAIKVLAPHFAQDVELVRRFLDEARAANRIHHPHIVDIFSFGELPGPRPYFVMEYLEGESLAEAIEHEHVRQGEIGRLLHQICSALSASHAVGIVHRDLKPENIWIARPAHADSYVKLLDFGIAKLLDPTRTNLTQTGVVMGTPLYMSPEQCLGREVGAGTDIYAMGVLLYRLFAGRHPFVGTVTTELAIKHVTEPPPPPSSFRPLPGELERLILECLAKDPAARPAGAEILGARLEEALAAWPEHRMAAGLYEAGGVDPAAPPVIPQISKRDDRTAPVPAKRSRQRPWPWLVVGLVAAGLVAGAWLLLRPPPATPVARPAEVVRPAAEAKPAASAAEPTTAAEPTPEEKKPPTARAVGRARTVAKAVTSRRGEPTTLVPTPGETRAKTAEADPASTPIPAEPPTPAPRPTRAQERGLLDENPLRR